MRVVPGTGMQMPVHEKPPITLRLAPAVVHAVLTVELYCGGPDGAVGSDPAVVVTAAVRTAAPGVMARKSAAERSSPEKSLDPAGAELETMGGVSAGESACVVALPVGIDDGVDAGTPPAAEIIALIVASSEASSSCNAWSCAKKENCVEALVLTTCAEAISGTHKQTAIAAAMHRDKAFIRLLYYEDGARKVRRPRW